MQRMTYTLRVQYKNGTHVTVPNGTGLRRWEVRAMLIERMIENDRDGSNVVKWEVFPEGEEQE